ncbi:MAG: chromo domain-containing protein, partial [Microcystaceae cyanobacterium]
MHIFKNGIKDDTYGDLKLRCRQDKWSLDKFVTEIRAEDLERSKERQADAIYNRRVLSVGEEEKQPTTERKSRGQERKARKNGGGNNNNNGGNTNNNNNNRNNNVTTPTSSPPEFKLANRLKEVITPAEKQQLDSLRTFDEKMKWYRDHKIDLYSRVDGNVRPSNTSNSNSNSQSNSRNGQNQNSNSNSTDVVSPNTSTSVNWLDNTTTWRQNRVQMVNFRNQEAISDYPYRSQPYSLIDNGADITTLGRNWVIIFRSGDTISLSAQAAIQQHHPPVTMERVTGIAKVQSTRGPIIIQVNSAVTTLGESPDIETLIKPEQLMHHGVQVDARSHEFGGRQCITLPVPEHEDPLLIPLIYREGKFEFTHELPSEEDQRTLPTYELTSAEPWNPYEVDTVPFNFEQSLKNRTQKLGGHHVFNIKNLKRWKKLLYLNDMSVVKKTLLATTQLAQVMRPSEDIALLQHEKRRIYEFKYRRINETVAVDLIEATTGKQSVRGAYYLIVFVGKTSKFTKVYHLKTKDQAIRAFQSFLRDVGIPEKVLWDGAGELGKAADVQAEMLRYKIKEHITEPHHQHQNRTESRNRDLKRLIHRILGESAAPDRYWCYAAEHAATILNATAKATLTWRTPFEVCLGDTPDISTLYQFRFYDAVKYTTPGIPFPNVKDLPGRFLGVAYNVGDLLTYKIEPDNLSYRDFNRHILLHRSAVVLDSGNDKRVNALRPADPHSEEDNSLYIWLEEPPHSYLDDIASSEEQTSIINTLTSEGDEAEISEPISAATIETTFPSPTIRIDPQYETENNTLLSSLGPDLPSAFDSSVDKLFDVKSILRHRLKSRQPQLLIDWEVGGEPTWEPLWMLKEDIPELVSEYIIEHKLQRPFQPDWAKRTQEQFVNLRLQIRNSRSQAPTMMYGIPVPRSV